MSYPYTPVPGSPPPKEVAAQPTAPLGPARIEYMRSYHYIFESPNWVMNVVWLGLAVLLAGAVPVAGILVYIPLFGYLYDVVETLYLTGGKRYPDVDSNRLEYYFHRGVWPFLVSLIVGAVVSVVLVPLFWGGMIAMFVLLAAVAESDAGPIVIAVVIPMFVILAMAAGMVMGLISMPFTLRAGLTQDFGQSFDFGWAKDFVRKVWFEAVLANLFLMATAMVALLAGLAAFCVGVYAAEAIVFLAGMHITYQLYNLYLARGGTPIPLKVAAPAGPPPMPL